MESAESKIALQIAECRVVQVKATAVTIALGQGVHITIHTLGFQHNVKEGDKLPLFTEMTRALPVSTPKL